MSRLTGFIRRWRDRRSPPKNEEANAVWPTFFANLGRPGLMVEVGAADPAYLSMGSFFRAKGWRVVSVEPNSRFASRHRAAGNEILEYACSDVDADDVPFTIVDVSRVNRAKAVTDESFSSLGVRGDFAAWKDRLGDRVRQTQVLVKQRRLDTLLSQYAPTVQSIDLLAIDVEGWELEVMRGLSFDRFRPSVVIMENMFRDTRYTAFLAERGYRLWREINPNQIYQLSRQGSTARLSKSHSW